VEKATKEIQSAAEAWDRVISAYENSWRRATEPTYKEKWEEAFNKVKQEKMEWVKSVKNLNSLSLLFNCRDFYFFISSLK
jgi:uncharacterized protein YukE